MSLSASWSGGLWSKLIGLFRGPRDPVTRNIREAVYMLDRMASFIDSTRRALESKYEEHQRKAKLFASEGKKEYQAIFEEESKHISTLLALFTKVYYDVIRVRYRLETITLVEEPLKLLPEIAQELDAIKPEIEKIAPELTSMLYEVKRRISSIMSSTNSSLEMLAGMYGVSSSSVEKTSDVKALPLPPKEPPKSEAASPQTVAVESPNNIPLSTLKNLILEEIRRTGGIFVISDFSRKYRVPQHIVRQALKKLEEEGVIKLR